VEKDYSAISVCSGLRFASSLRHLLDCVHEDLTDDSKSVLQGLLKSVPADGSTEEFRATALAKLETASDRATSLKRKVCSPIPAEPRQD
jgi:hypothetical protein